MIKARKYIKSKSGFYMHCHIISVRSVTVTGPKAD